MVTTDGGAAGRAGLAPMTVVDIAPYLAGARDGAAQVAAAAGGACESLGFFGVVGHGVPDQAVDDMETVSRAFFALPLAEKMGYKPRRWLDFVGYYPPESLAAAATIGERGPKDLFEAFSCGPYYEFRVPGAGEDRLKKGRDLGEGGRAWAALPACVSHPPVFRAPRRGRIRRGSTATPQLYARAVKATPKGRASPVRRCRRTSRRPTAVIAFSTASGRSRW